MKTLVFLIYGFFLLLGGGEYFYAATSPSQVKYFSTKFTQYKHTKIINVDQNTTIIEDNDIELEEDYLSGEDFNSNCLNHFPLGKYTLINTLYRLQFRQLLLNYYFTKIKISSFFFTSSSPIFITQRVLRI